MTDMPNEMAKTDKQGTVAIVMEKDGGVMFSLSDFDVSGYGGFSAHQAQKKRLKDAVSREFVRLYFPHFMGNNLSDYTKQKILIDLINSGAAKIEYVCIGAENV